MQPSPNAAVPKPSTIACLTLSVLCPTSMLFSQQVAFPGAEGYGKFTTGGRGGTVYEVTTLNPTGPGSLGAAIAASGPRTVVFRVSGTIDGNFNIRNDKITIAGQTAPGDGITIKGTLGISASDVNIRYIRTRAEASGDALGGRYEKNIIVDHVSSSWSGDEVLSIYHNENVTIQWSMITEAATSDHAFGGIWGNNYGTYHHNLMAHNASRNPRWASGSKYNDYRNNVLYNWDYNSAYGGEAQEVGNATLNFSTINMIGNYYKPGPATNSGVRDRIVEPSARSSTDKGSWYVAENFVVGAPAVTANNWLGVDGSNYIQLSQPWDAMPISQQTPQEAYLSVLEHVGASFPRRDSVDMRIIEEVRNGTFTYGNSGMIVHPNDVGGWPTLNSAPAPADNDHDGMPDAWEVAHGLNPNVANNNADFDSDGYTDLEEYLNDLGAFPATSVLNFTNANGRYAQSGNWSHVWQPSRFDVAKISNGTATVDAVGQHAGTLLVGSDAGTNARLNVTGGWLQVHKRLEVGSTSTGRGTVTLSGGSLRVGELLRVRESGTIHFAGGQVDIGSGAGIFDYAGSNSPLTELTAQVVSGRNGGAWNGPGIISSALAPGMSIAVVEASALGLSSFAGQSIDTTTVLMARAWLGDADLDGDVDGVDVGKWAVNFTGSLAEGAGTSTWTEGDWDQDGDVDGIDVGLWAINFTGSTGDGLGSVVVQLDDLTSPAAGILESLGITVVPEPGTTAAMCVLAGTLLAARRRRARA